MFEYASPAFIVRKKDGSERMVVDFRIINKETKNISFSVPIFHEFLETLAEGWIIELLDLAQGHLQVPLKQISRERLLLPTTKLVSL